MKTYSPSSIIRLLLFIAGIAVFIAAGLSLAVNAVLTFYKPAIERAANRYLGFAFSLHRINYFPPNKIIIRDLAVDSSRLLTPVRIALRRVELTFDIYRLLRRRNFAVQSVSVYDSRVDYGHLVLFLKDNGPDIVRLILSLPRSNFFAVRLNNLKLLLSAKDGFSNFLAVDMILRLRGNSVDSFGTCLLSTFFSKPNSSVKSFYSAPLAYNFKADITGQGFALTNVEFNCDDFYIKLWGALQKDILRLNGFSYVGYLNRGKVRPRWNLNLIERVRLLYRRNRFTRVVGNALPDLNIFDIDCLVRFASPKVEVQMLNFSLNNIPLSLKGECMFLDPVAANFSLVSHPERERAVRFRARDDFEAYGEGILTAGGFSGDLGIDFVRRTMGRNTHDQIRMNTAGLSAGITEHNDKKISANKIDFIYKSEGSPYHLFFSDFNAVFVFLEKEVKLAHLGTALYDGALEATGRIDTVYAPLKSEFDLNVKDVSAEHLESLLVNFSKIYGKLSSQIHYTTYPRTELTGNLLIYDGILDNYQFFVWLADTFAMPSLKKVDFSRLSLKFTVNDDGAGMEDIYLRAPQVRLDGYFNVQENDLVSSKLSLALARRLLLDSPKFRALARILGKDFPFLTFDFQLSGLVDSMNFKWLNSIFKQRLKDSIPDFVERGIERKVEAIINSP